MLSLVIFLPLIGALALLLIGNRDGARDQLIRVVTLASRARHLRGDARALGGYRPGTTEFQFVERYAWIRPSASTTTSASTGISLLLIVLTGFLTPLALLSSWESGREEGEGIQHLRAAARIGDARRVRVAGPVPVSTCSGTRC